MAITVVQTQFIGGSSTSISRAFDSNVVAGNLITLCLGATSEVNVLTVSDSQGNTYTEHLRRIFTGGTELAVEHHSAPIGSSAANTVTITANFTTAMNMQFTETSGLDNSDPINGTESNQGTNTSSSTSGSGITTTRADVLLQCNVQKLANTTHTPGSGFTLINAPTNFGAGEFQVLTATATTIGTFTFPQSTDWVSAMVAYQGPSATDGEASLAGVGTIDATGADIVPTDGRATLIGAGLITATPFVDVFAVATLTGTGEIVAAALGGDSGNATITGTGAIVATGKALEESAATLTGAGFISGTPGGIRAGVASITGTGEIDATGFFFDFPKGEAILNGSGFLVARGRDLNPAAVETGGRLIRRQLEGDSE